VCFGFVGFALISMIIQELDSIQSTVTPKSHSCV
jgi:hypothetical protein